MTAELTTDEQERLHIERNHLLVSLDDLDAEFAAGDLDEADYETLRDDYTARAATLTRALDSGVVTRTGRAQRSLSGTLGWVLGASAIAALAAVAMIMFSGARGSNDVASGDIRQSTTTLLAEAAAAFGQGDPARSVDLYTEVLDLQPTNVEALTYRGWVRYQTGAYEMAEVDFDEAVAFDPDYADVRVFRAVAALDDELFEAAAEELRAFDRSNPTPIATQLVQQRQLRERIAVGAVLEDVQAGQFDLAASGLTLDEAQLAGETMVGLALPNESLVLFDGILTEEPDYAPAMAWRGWTLALTAQAGAEDLFPDAERWLDAAVEADPTYPDARVFRAFVYRRLERRDEAIADLAAYDSLPNQPADLEQLVADFGLREDLGG